MKKTTRTLFQAIVIIVIIAIIVICLYIAALLYVCLGYDPF